MMGETRREGASGISHTNAKFKRLPNAKNFWGAKVEHARFEGTRQGSGIFWENRKGLCCLVRPSTYLHGISWENLTISQ